MPSKERLADWGYGDPDSTDFDEVMASFTAGGVTLTCHRDLIPIFSHLVTEISSWGIDVSRGSQDTWGYVRDDTRQEQRSWHSVGAAVDLDITRHTTGSRDTTFPIRKTLALADDLGLVWGRTWADLPQPAHFEVAHPLAVMTGIGRRLRDAGADRPAFRRTLSQGDIGPAVRWMQERLVALGYLALAPDGRFGWHTARAVRRFEADRGFRINGVVSASQYDALAHDKEQ